MYFLLYIFNYRYFLLLMLLFECSVRHRLIRTTILVTHDAAHWSEHKITQTHPPTVMDPSSTKLQVRVCMCAI